jgi:hypothetical protein
MPRLEDFQNGIPLNDELRRLKAGVLDEPQAETAPPAWEPGTGEQRGLNRPLDDGERNDLRCLLTEPGWRVLERLRKQALQRMEQAAIVLSQDDPLGNAQKIANGWANLACFKDMVKLDRLMIAGEIAKLKPGAKEDENASVLDR